MSNTLILLIALIIAIMIVVIIQFVLFKKGQEQKKEYPELWDQFELSKNQDNHDDMLKLGNKLFFHKFLPSEHLKIIHDTAKELESDFPEFKNLRLNAGKKMQHRVSDESYRSE